MLRARSSQMCPQQHENVNDGMGLAQCSRRIMQADSAACASARHATHPVGVDKRTTTHPTHSEKAHAACIRMPEGHRQLRCRGPLACQSTCRSVSLEQCRRWVCWPGAIQLISLVGCLSRLVRQACPRAGATCCARMDVSQQATYAPCEVTNS